MKGKINNIIRIPTSLKGKFFRFWLEFLRPFHNLSERELQIATLFLKQRYELTKVIKDDLILERVLMGEDTKKAMREECNMSLPHFQVIMGKLRKNGFIVDGKINPKFIPNISDEESFQLLLFFDLSDESK